VYGSAVPVLALASVAVLTVRQKQVLAAWTGIDASSEFARLVDELVVPVAASAGPQIEGLVISQHA